MSETTQLAVPMDDALAILQAAGVQLAQAREDAPRISIQGKNFRYYLNGEWHKVTKEEDGEVVPATMIQAVILGHAPSRSYALFEGGFKEGESSAPVCWSHDSKKPDSIVTEPKATSCESCEKRVVGSAFTQDGQPTRACKESKLISVVIDADSTSTPLQFRLAVGSLWQTKERSVEDEANGWYAYDAYVTHLAKMGIAHPCMVKTRIKFGSGAGVTVLFKRMETLPEDMLVKVATLAGSEEVKKTLGLVPRTPSAQKAATPSIAEPVEAPAQVAAPVTAPEPVAEKPKAAKVEKPKPTPQPPQEAPAVFDEQLNEW